MTFPAGKKIRFSSHAQDRMGECQVDYFGAVELLQESVTESVPDKKYKHAKYGDLNNGVTYWRNGTIIFTVAEKHDSSTGLPFYFVITMTNQLTMLKHY